jgi:hypothetical protein
VIKEVTTMDVMIIARNNEGSLVAISPVETDEAEEQIKDQVEDRSWAVEGTAVVIAAAEFRSPSEEAEA